MTRPLGRCLNDIVFPASSQCGYSVLPRELEIGNLPRYCYAIPTKRSDISIGVMLNNVPPYHKVYQTLQHTRLDSNQRQQIQSLLSCHWTTGAMKRQFQDIRTLPTTIHALFSWYNRASSHFHPYNAANVP